MVGEVKRSILVFFVEDLYFFEVLIMEVIFCVCGELVVMMRYVFDYINNFFFEVFGVFCVLLRFFVGG